MLPWLKDKKALKIAVIGDVILDEYLDGDVSRISPEAPVPIIQVQNKTQTPGGAGNTARNIQLAGGQAYLFSVCGEDQAKDELIKLLRKDGIHCENIIATKERETIKKTRVSSAHQQMLRIDWESREEISGELQEQLFQNLKSIHFHGILISDYGKGCLPNNFIKQIINHAQKLAIPCVVDPKGKNFEKYRGCTLITPNKKETLHALGESEPLRLSYEQLGRRLQEKWELNDILVTLGPEGMIHIPKSSKNECSYIKATAKEVFDVSGAGDTVAATATLCLASNTSVTELITIATIAAGLVVEKWGTQPINRHELEQAIYKQRFTRSIGGHFTKSDYLFNSKLAEKDFLIEEVKREQTIGKRIVFTNGCFDILHSGHLDYLQKAKECGDLLVVGINSDNSIKSIKGENRPIMSLEQRAHLLSGLDCIDWIIAFDELSPIKLIEELRPDVLVKGGDYTISEIVGSEFMLKNQKEVLSLPYLKGLSTTDIIDKIRQN